MDTAYKIKKHSFTGNSKENSFKMEHSQHRQELRTIKFGSVFANKQLTGPLPHFIENTEFARQFKLFFTLFEVFTDFSENPSDLDKIKGLNAKGNRVTRRVKYTLNLLAKEMGIANVVLDAQIRIIQRLFDKKKLRMDNDIAQLRQNRSAANNSTVKRKLKILRDKSVEHYARVRGYASKKKYAVIAPRMLLIDDFDQSIYEIFPTKYDIIQAASDPNVMKWTVEAKVLSDVMVDQTGTSYTKIRKNPIENFSFQRLPEVEEMPILAQALSIINTTNNLLNMQARNTRVLTDYMSSLSGHHMSMDPRNKFQF